MHPTLKIAICFYFLLPIFIIASTENEIRHNQIQEGLVDDSLYQNIKKSLKNSTPKETTKQEALINDFFDSIRHNNLTQLQKTVHDPKKFSGLYDADYTAEQLCNLQDQYGRMSLHTAAMHPHVTPEIAKLLIQSGAQLSTQDKLDLTPLDFPQNIEITKVLIKYGAKLTKYNSMLAQDWVNYQIEDVKEIHNCWKRAKIKTTIDISNCTIAERKRIKKMADAKKSNELANSTLAERKKLIDGLPQYQQEHAQQIKARQKEIAANVIFLNIQHGLENFHDLVVSQSSHATTQSLTMLQNIQDNKFSNSSSNQPTR